MTAIVSVDQTVQEWGNGLAVRITAKVAKAARFTRGQPIKVEVVEGGVFLRTSTLIGWPRVKRAALATLAVMRTARPLPHS